MDLKDIFGNSKSIEIRDIGDGRFCVTVTRKSRFIRKDAEKLIDKIRIAGANPANITLVINAPLCSKAKAILTKEGFNI